MADFLRDSLEKIGYTPSDAQCEQLNSFHKLLCEWNEFMNLTGITEYNEVVIKHFVDSSHCLIRLTRELSFWMRL